MTISTCCSGNLYAIVHLSLQAHKVHMHIQRPQFELSNQGAENELHMQQTTIVPLSTLKCS